MKHYYIVTMGCQMNEYDSDYLGQLLLESGFFPTTNYNLADLILVNTCAVRAKAEQKAFSLLGRLISLKRKKPNLILGIVGCVAQKEGGHLLKKFPELDLVLGTRELDRFPDILNTIGLTGERIAATNLGINPLPPLGKEGYFSGRIKSHITIMQGCNNFCSYCIVPYVRGREVSRPPETILKEAWHLVSEGVREISLLGQNVNSYRSEKDGLMDFPSLLRALSQIDSLLRIRFTTSHPKDLSDDLIRCFEELPNLCPHIHLPVQSGSNDTLKRMNRRYTREKYIERIHELRETKPDIGITSDMIVGFPGESDLDFELTLDLIKKIRFDNLFSFKYSDRKGTAAEKMEKKLDEETKSKRLSILQDLQKGITLEKNIELEGQIVEVLVEGLSKRAGQMVGRTGTNKIVNFKPQNNELGTIVHVNINHAFVNSLRGEPVN